MEYAASVLTHTDKQIQEIAEDIGNNIEKGAIIIADAKTGKILSFRSNMPEYYDKDTEEVDGKQIYE